MCTAELSEPKNGSCLRQPDFVLEELIAIQDVYFIVI
jgi:hypothetical protein